MASVKVAVRVRPLNKREGDLGSSFVVKVEGNIIHLFNNKSLEPPYDAFSSRDKLKQFTFDHSYWSVDPTHSNYASQEKIFDDLGIGVVESSFSGYNACIFAYGQTGSGKTHTMMGTEDNPGLTPRICERMFASMDKSDMTYRTEVSYLEIYNEHVRDLLREGPQANLKVREHPKDGPYVKDLSRRVVRSYREIAELLKRGNTNRTTASTGMNEHSSRSHAIFTIYFSQARIAGDLPSEINSKVHLVDLAGSERADSAGTAGERLKEGGSINKSLVTLGTVISALADINETITTSSSSSSTTSTQRRFIPYRNSVLTWLLKDSLGGNSRTVMVTTISPAECCYGETLSSLRYAKRAKKIVNTPSVNEDPNVRLIRELRAENAKLKRLLSDAMMQEGLTPLSEVAETREKLSKNEEKMQELMEAWTDKWKEVINVLKEHDMLALRKEGSGVLLDSNLPYLLCIDDSVLSTGMKLYHIKEGDTIIGRDNPVHKPDIVLAGRFIENIHCIVRFEAGLCYLVPGENAMCCIDSVQVVEPTKLTQGSMIQLGRNHFFRFNDPDEAAKLREEMNEGYDRGNMSHVWKDIQRAWSSFSMADSAIDSEFKDWLDSEPQEMRRRDLLRVPADSLPNIPRRSSGRVCGEPENDSLAEAQMKIKTLNEEIESELLNVVDGSGSEDDVTGKKSFDVELEILRMERERQEEEWYELEKQKNHQHSIRVEDQMFLNKKQEQLEKMREAEKKIWDGEIESMRAMMDEEVQQLCEAPRSCLSGNSYASSSSDFTFGNSSFEFRRPSAVLRSCRSDHSWNRNQTNRDLFECSSLDRFRSGWSSFRPTSSSSRRSVASRLTLEDVLPSDVETFKLTSLCSDYQSDSSFRLPADLHEDSFSNLSFGVEDEAIALNDLEGLLSQMYRTVRSVFFDQFGAASKVSKHPTKCQQLVQRLNEKLHTVAKLLSRSEKLSPDEFPSKEIEGKVELVESLLSLYESLSLLDHQQGGFMFAEAAETLVKINRLSTACKNLIVEEVDDDQMKALVQTEVCLRREMFLYKMSEQWDQMVEWNNKGGRTCKDSAYKISLGLKMAINNRKKMKSLCEAMFSCGVLDEKLKSFSKNFTTQLMLPGILGGFLPHSDDRPCCIRVVKCHQTPLQSPSLPDIFDKDHSSPSRPSSLLSPSSSSSSSSFQTHSSPARIVERVEQSLRLLWCTFTFPIEACPTYSLVAAIGDHACEEILEMLCKYSIVPYLSHLDSKCDDDEKQVECWRIFNETVQMVFNFQEQLVQLGFMTTPSESFLLQMMPLVRSCVSRRRKHYSESAQQIGVSTLGVAVRVSPASPMGVEAPGEVQNVEEENKSDGGGGWSAEKFAAGCIGSMGALKMPVCSVSKSSSEVVRLLYKILYDAQSCSPPVVLLLQPSFAAVAQHFDAIVSNHHLPNNATFHALNHNSCLFVAQHLLVVEKFSSQLLQNLHEQLLEEKMLNEMDLRNVRLHLKETAETDFTESVNKQRNIIRHVLAQSQGFACAADDAGLRLMGCINRILDAIKDVSSQWNSTLSFSLCYKSVGILLDELVKEVIQSLMQVVEFSEDDCQVIKEILNNIMHKAPNLINTTSDASTPNIQLVLHEHVSSWMQLNELYLLFGLNLNEIRDRWSVGLGPLSLHFSAKQVASLIRAIFENTAKREVVIREILASPSVHATP